MSTLDWELQQELAQIRSEGLHRALHCIDSPQGPRIEMEGRSLENFSSNDYLGLASHPAVKEAAIRAVERFGAGSGASRLVCGSLRPHHDLEDALAAFKNTQAALAFSSGYATAVGTICALVSRGDTIILDKLVHASIVDAARLSGAAIRVIPHNNLAALERLLTSVTRSRTAPRSPGGDSPNTSGRRQRILIVIESVYSMDGDLAPLREIIELKERFGAWLMVDEAHGTGVLGEGGRGLADLLRVSDRIEIQMGTLGKALGSAGGYVCGTSSLIEFLINRARSFIFSTAPAPAAAAAATAALGLLQSAEGPRRLSSLRALIRQTTLALNKETTGEAAPGASAIVPILLGDETRAVAFSDTLRRCGFFVPAIRYPTVSRGRARLRLTLTAAHDPRVLALLLETLQQLQAGRWEASQ